MKLNVFVFFCVAMMVSQVSLQATYSEEVFDYAKNQSIAAVDSVTDIAKKGFDISKDLAVKARHGITAQSVVVSNLIKKKASSAYSITKKAMGHIVTGFTCAGLTLYGGVAGYWVNHHDACIVAATLTGVAAVYAMNKYRKARALARKIELLQKQQAAL